MTSINMEIKWAVIFTGMMLAWLALERLVGLHSTYIEHHATLTNLVAIPAILVYYLAFRDKRENVLGGSMSYKQGFLSGLIITAIVTALVPLTQYLTITVITPHYFTNVIEFVVEEGRMTRSEAVANFNMRSYIIQGLIGTPIMGVLTSAVVAYFTQKS